MRSLPRDVMSSYHSNVTIAKDHKEQQRENLDESLKNARQLAVYFGREVDNIFINAITSFGGN